MANSKFNARQGLSVGSTPTDVIDSTGAITAASLTSSGLVYSNSGGFKFPDGTTQLTAGIPATNSVSAKLFMMMGA
jgi:hypothetical protein